MNLHTKYKHDALLTLGSRHDTVLWFNEVGVAHAYVDRFKKVEDRQVIRYGLQGSHDLIGLTNIDGVAIFLGVEVKSGNAVQSKVQKNFEKKVLELGGISLLFRGDTKKLIEEFENARNRCRAIIRALGDESISGTRG